MLLAAFLLIGTPLPTTLDEAPTRSKIMADSLQIFAGTDTDGDGTLSPAEWTAELREPDPARPRADQEAYAGLRAYMISVHSQMDGNRDGKVSFDELVREPLARFDCMDRDRDLRLSQAEIESGRERCPPGPAVGTGFVSEPPANDPPAR